MKERLQASMIFQESFNTPISGYLQSLITQLCNLLSFSGRFPGTCKIAKLKPLFKKGSKTDPKNDRPTSLLPLMLKVLGRIVHEQTMEFFWQTQHFIYISIRISKKSFYRLLYVFFKEHQTITKTLKAVPMVKLKDKFFNVLKREYLNDKLATFITN